MLRKAFDFKKTKNKNLSCCLLCFRLWDHIQNILDGPAGCCRGQLLTSVRPVRETLIRHGKSLPQLHLGPSPHRESDPAHAVHLLQLLGPMVGGSGLFGSNKSITEPDV